MNSQKFNRLYVKKKFVRIIDCRWCKKFWLCYPDNPTLAGSCINYNYDFKDLDKDVALESKKIKEVSIIRKVR